MSLIALILFFAAGAAAAAPTPCTSALTGTIDGDVVVPPNETCSIDHATILGNVTVQTNAALFVSSTSGNTAIEGNVSANGCDKVQITSLVGLGRVAIGGNVTIQNCTANVLSGAVGNDTTVPPRILIGGNAKCNNNVGGCRLAYLVIGGNVECSGNGKCSVESDVVADNVTVNNNYATAPLIDGNVIGRDLKCNGNTPTPIGGNNLVAGDKAGQCGGL
jgi:hypothetical protein